MYMFRFFDIFKKLNDFQMKLDSDGKTSKNTIKKYMGDLKRFREWCAGNNIIFVNEKVVQGFICYLRNKESSCCDKTINGYLSSLLKYFVHIKKNIKIKRLKVKKELFYSTKRQIEDIDVQKLISTAFELGKERLGLMIEFIIHTGIRVSEFEYINVSNLKLGVANVNCKGKERKIIIPRKICDKLLTYCRKHNITNKVFITKSGKSILRSNIWKEMSVLSEKAHIDKDKVFPHNFRHYFSRCFYYKTKDLDKLARILGHSSIETTRIYTIESEESHRNLIESLNLPFIDTTKY